jgi:hypothetical protein
MEVTVSAEAGEVLVRITAESLNGFEQRSFARGFGMKVAIAALILLCPAFASAQKFDINCW